MKSILTVILSIVIAMMLSIIPLPVWANFFRPLWVPMVVLYWVLIVPERVSVGIAWIVGLLLDVLTGTLLGEHALALLIISFIMIKLHLRVRMAPMLQQSITVFLLLCLYQGIQIWTQGMIGQLPSTWWAICISPLVSALLWPWASWLLNTCSARLFRAPDRFSL